MFLSYYGLDKNLFQKGIKPEYTFESTNYKNMISRLNYLKEINGIGVFIGEPGCGKTLTLRSFVNKLSKELYKIVYISASKLSVFELLDILCKSFGINVGNCYRNEIEEKIQMSIKKIKQENNMDTIIIIDNVENLKKEVIQELKFLYDFDMDSVDYVSLIIVGNSDIIYELQKSKCETFSQRIVVKYQLEKLNRTETEEYIKSRLLLSGQSKEIFSKSAINSLFQLSKGNIRVLNNLIINALIIGYQLKKDIINEEIIMMSKQENDF